MSICIYPVTQRELAARTAPRDQLAALAPFPKPRERGAPWGLTRRPLAFRQLTEDGWTETLELPKPKPGEGPPPLRAPGVPALPREPRAGFEEFLFPESLSFTIWLDTANPGTGYTHGSVGPMPWPFELIGVTTSSSAASINVVHWGLFTNDSKIGGEFPEPLGQPLSFISTDASDDFTLSNGGDYLHHSETGTLQTIQHNNPATGLLGTIVRDPNKYLTLIARTVAGQAMRFGLTMTVRRVAPIPVTTRLTSIPQPRSAPAPQRAPAPPPPPARSAPPPGAHTTFGARGPVWGPGAGNPTPWRGYAIASYGGLAPGGH